MLGYKSFSLFGFLKSMSCVSGVKNTLTVSTDTVVYLFIAITPNLPWNLISL